MIASAIIIAMIHKSICTARNLNVDNAKKLFAESLLWRAHRKPHLLEQERPDWESFLSKESETGKIYVPGK